METDLVSFFKRAISAPPDVEEFKLRGYDFIQKMFVNNIAGARAGSNYFVQEFSDTGGSNVSVLLTPARQGCGSSVRVRVWKIRPVIVPITRRSNARKFSATITRA
ncbi:MAG TPA: hypothetical protein VMF08_11460, partial [Candidatus Sulfotelmatobacter sp.]|nr:hypothetical protein [Candidatus Sulfotelmatobacter sp.]